MSFLGGPECSTGANPLSQFQKQSSADTSLQRDRLTSTSPHHLNAFRSQQGLPNDAAFQDFSQQGPTFNAQLPHEAAHLEQLRHEQENMQRSGGATPNWAGEFAQQPPHFAPEEFAQQQQRGNANFRPQDFAGFRAAQMGPSPQRQQSPASFQRPQMYGAGMGGMGMGMGMGMQRPMMYNQSQFMGQPAAMDQQEYEGKGKGRVQELSDTDWEAQFAELSTADKEAEVERLDREGADAVERELNSLDDKSDVDWAGFHKVWDSLVQGTDGSRNILNDFDFDSFLGSQNKWEDFDGQGNHDFSNLGTHEFGQGPQLGNYMFEENNVFSDLPNAFEEGMKIMREGGNLSLAALAFEGAVQQKGDFVEAWVALGQAQAQNEKESPAIRALEQAMKLDPDNLDALMGLSVSYTNEGYDSLAYRSLERWISVKYPQLDANPTKGSIDQDLSFTDRHQLHDKVTNLFLAAAQLNPEGGTVDVDVQVGLGVLFYGSEDYDKAVDCFSAALNSAHHGSLKREGEEHLLWNRLGATLANSGRSAEAIDAYSQALELRPNFVRARYNLGVSCINLGVHEEAAAHLLGALSMHRVVEKEGKQQAAEILHNSGAGERVGSGPSDDEVLDGLLQQNQSTNLYDTLRRVFTQMGRRELAERVGADMDLDAFRGEFEF